MFVKLRNRFILTTMGVATAILFVAFAAIYITSAGNMPRPLVGGGMRTTTIRSGDIEQLQIIEEHLEAQRAAYLSNLLISLLVIGLGVEIAVFAASFMLAEWAIRPVREAYTRQKDFVASASHELKTPLAVIGTNFEALSSENKLKGPWAENIALALTRANQEVSDLMLLAQAEDVVTGKVEEVDVSRVLSKQLKLLQTQVEGRLSEEITVGVKVRAVRSDLEKVIGVLLENAAKYADKSIVVKLDKRSLRVSNDGAKIPADKLERVFERFYQVDKTAEGSGLGLAIAKALADRNHWGLEATSGDMTTFQIVFRNSGIK